MMLPILQLPSPPVTAWLLEFPANPNLLILHGRHEWTYEMSEVYRSTHPPIGSWLAPLLSSIPSLQEITILRHHIRLRKRTDASWGSIIPVLQEKLYAPGSSWETASEQLLQDRSRTLLLEQAQSSVGANRWVAEGVNIAQQHPVTSMLFIFPGLITATVEEQVVTVKRAICYSWNELEPSIFSNLRSFLPRILEENELHSANQDATSPAK